MFKNLLWSLMAIALVSNASAYYSKVDLPAKAKGKIKGVRVTDVTKFYGNITPSLLTVTKSLRSASSSVYGKGAKQVHNLFFNAVPKKSGSNYKLNLGAVVRYKDNSIKFHKIDVTYNKSDINGARIYTTDYSLSRADLEVKVSLVDRRMVIVDSANDMKMVFPLGVGSFDEGVLNYGRTSLLTPRFKTAWLDAAYAEFKKKKPRYFAKKPFIRVSTPENKFTGIGFHIQPFPKKNAFVRAFDSHGCIRMQEGDLYTLYWLVSKNPSRKTPLYIDYTIDENLEHPFPKRNKPYRTVVNIGSKTNKQWKLDKDQLIMAGLVYKRSAPVTELVNDSSDHYHDSYNYKTSDFVKQYYAKCKAEAYSGIKKSNYEKSRDYKKAMKNADKEYKSCTKRIQTKAGKLYKWWVHGN